MIVASVLRFKDIGDCTNNGISSKHDRVFVWDPDLEVFTPDSLYPILKVVRRIIYGREFLHLQPVEKGGWMAGGNFAFTSDSRFPNQYPLSIHDRKE